MTDSNVRLLNARPIAGAGTFVSEAYKFAPRSVRDLALQSNFVHDAGGTSLKVYLQTSLDGGDNWIDVASHAFTTTSARKVSAVKRFSARAEAVPADGGLADDTVLDGLIGDRCRVKWIVAGTYSGDTELTVDVVPG